MFLICFHDSYCCQWGKPQRGDVHRCWNVCKRCHPDELLPLDEIHFQNAHLDGTSSATASHVNFSVATFPFLLYWSDSIYFLKLLWFRHKYSVKSFHKMVNLYMVRRSTQLQNDAGAKNVLHSNWSMTLGTAFKITVCTAMVRTEKTVKNNFTPRTHHQYFESFCNVYYRQRVGLYSKRILKIRHQL